MSKERTIFEKYRLFGFSMAVLLLLEYCLPYKVMWLNPVFFVIAFLKIILCRCMEYAFGREVKKGNDFKKCKLVYEIQTYFYLVVFILDVQSSFTIARSKDNAMLAGAFFMLAWVLQFFFGAAGVFYFLKAQNRSVLDWCIINTGFLGMLIHFYIKALYGDDTSIGRILITAGLLIWRTILWFRATKPRPDKEVKEEYL